MPTCTHPPAAVLQFDSQQCFNVRLFIWGSFFFGSKLFSQTAVWLIKCQNVALSSNDKNIINVCKL